MTKDELIEIAKRKRDEALAENNTLKASRKAMI